MAPRTYKLGRDRRMKILLVENSPKSTMAFAKFFSTLGCEFRSVDTWSTACPMVSNWDPSLVILRSKLPDFQAWEACFEMRSARHEHRPYVVVISSGVSRKDKARCMECGADVYLIEPVNVFDIRQAMAAAEQGEKPNGYWNDKNKH